jgi:hypothetical protein
VGRAVVVSAGVTATVVSVVSNPVSVMAPQRDQQPRVDPQHCPAGSAVHVRQDANARVVPRGDGRERLARAHRVDTTVDVVAMVCAVAVVVVTVAGSVPVVM